MVPYKDSLLTMIIYFFYRSTEEWMKESVWWNKLFRDLPREVLSIVGMVPGNEEIENIEQKNGILFPVYFDKDLMIVRRFLISITPFKIIMNRRGMILYMAPAYKEPSSQEEFYYVVIELLRKVKKKHKGIGRDIDYKVRNNLIQS